MMRTQIPRFRLPEAVLDEEVGYILGLGSPSCGWASRVDSLKALLDEGYDAVFVGTRRAARPRPRPAGPQGSRAPTSISASTGSPASRSATSTGSAGG